MLGIDTNVLVRFLVRDDEAQFEKARRLIRREVDARGEDRKSTRLNSSHSQISYAVFCLKKQMNTLLSQYVAMIALFALTVPASAAGAPEVIQSTNATLSALFAKGDAA